MDYPILHSTLSVTHLNLRPMLICSLLLGPADHLIGCIHTDNNNVTCHLSYVGHPCVTLIHGPCYTSQCMYPYLCSSFLAVLPLPARSGC